MTKVRADIVDLDECRKTANDVFLAGEIGLARDLAVLLLGAVDEIERLRGLLLVHHEALGT